MSPGCPIFNMPSKRGREIAQTSTLPQRHTFFSSETSRNGTGFVVCAVCGPPVAGSINISALPWSAVISMRATTLLDRLVDAAKLRIDGLNRLHRRLHLAGVPDHIGVREVDDDYIERGVVERLDDNIGDAGRGHLGSEIVGCDLLRCDELPVFTAERLLDAAVEEVRHVRVLFCLSHAQDCAGSRQPSRWRAGYPSTQPG